MTIISEHQKIPINTYLPEHRATAIYERQLNSDSFSRPGNENGIVLSEQFHAQNCSIGWFIIYLIHNEPVNYVYIDLLELYNYTDKNGSEIVQH